MSNNRQKVQGSSSRSSSQQPGGSQNPPSQIEATYSTLQLPISASNQPSLSSQAQPVNTLCQSLVYRAETNTQFSRAKAILWEIKFIVNGLVSKKCMPSASSDVLQLAEQFGSDFDKYLIRELLEQIDLKDANKPSRDRTETFKVQFLNDELKRICERMEFLTYFDELSRGIFGEGKNKEFLKEITARLKLSPKMSLLIALSLHESTFQESDRVEAANLVKQKVVEYSNANSKAEPLEEYALHRLLHIIRMYPEFENSDQAFDTARKFLIDHHQIKPANNVALRLQTIDNDLIYQNPTFEDPANSIIRPGSGISHLPFCQKFLEPWEVLIDLGHYSAVNYQTLGLALQDFKDITEKNMANMLLHLSVHYSGQDDLHSRIVFNLFEVNKLGDPQGLQKEPNYKNTQMTWHVAHFSRAFRENYSKLDWTKVLESFAELTSIEAAQKFDSKAYAFFLQLLNKSKPQNLQVPISLLLESKWASPLLQFKFLQSAINCYISGEDKTFNFSKCTRRVSSLNDNFENQAMIEVWGAPEVLQALLYLSESVCFTKVRQFLDAPINNCPQYLLLALSQVQGDYGAILMDELISILMQQQLDLFPQSNTVLHRLWELNQQMMVRAICELCGRDDSRSVVTPQNLNKVLDISMEIKDSMTLIVNCQDYDFAVALGIIAGKRDFLNYDQWLRERIQNVGNSFLKSLMRYMYENVYRVVQEQMNKANMDMSILSKQAGSPEEEKAAQILENVLEKAHLSKTTLTLTIEILNNNPHIVNAPTPDTEEYKLIRDLVAQIQSLVPRQASSQQQSDMEKVANSYFEKVFNAEPDVVEDRIKEFIDNIRKLKSSQNQGDRDLHYVILNTFYEEYRFILSFRDRGNLISFAKLFGGIINKNIIETTLMEISLKFIIQALGNSDNRLIFGIEALKRSYLCLSDFRKQFQDIYTYVNKIKQYDPEFHAKFVQFHHQTFNPSSKTQNFEQMIDIKSDQQKAQPIEQTEGLSQEKQSNKKDRGESSQKAANKQRESMSQSNKKQEKQKQSPKASRKEQEEKNYQNQSHSLNIQSEAFNRDVKLFEKPAPQPDMQKKASISINVNASTFNPTEMQQQQFETPQRQYTQSVEVQEWQKNIDRKIGEAKAKRAEIRFEDLIEDPLLKQISPDAQKEIRFICNNTGTSTFDTQLDKAQNLLQGQNAEINLTWFLHYFLIQRLLGVPQLNIYIDLFKRLNNTNVISKAIRMSIDIMKRCMLIPEEDFNKVVKRAQNQKNIILQFLQQLGTFIGILTLASNRPIFSTECDLKQMLMEGYMQNKKYVIIFVCRILREAPKSQLQIFNRHNPWIISLLEILREIYEPNKQSDEVQIEIQILFKEFGLALNEFPTIGFLKARINNQLMTQQQQAEAIYFDKKEMIIPQRVQENQEQHQNQRQSYPQEEEQVENQLSRHNNQMQIFNQVIITPNNLFRIFKLSEMDYRKVISEALEASIKEILPPVVTRSVSIALTTTKQLVLKDFTYDSDIAKVTEAINQFAKNSAGSLALVTCREPLRIALKEYLKKEIEATCFKYGTKSGLVNGNQLRSSENSESALAEAEEMDQRLNSFIKDHEELITDVANSASQENLELGCNIIKSTVFDDTAKRILQDEDIQQAMLKRKQANDNGIVFVDEAHVASFKDLPEILRPDRLGLTAQQFRVYTDFSKLNQKQRQDQHGVIQYPEMQRNITYPVFDNQAPKAKEPRTHTFTTENIISDIELAGSILTPFTRSLLSLKMKQFKQDQSQTADQKVQFLKKNSEEVKIWWRFVEKKLFDLQMGFDHCNQPTAQMLSLLEIISKIANSIDTFQGRILNDLFFNFEMNTILNVNFNIYLLLHNVVPLKEWDQKISTYIREAPGSAQEKVVAFVTTFIDQAILQKQLQTLSSDKLPFLFKETKKITFSSDSQSQQLQQSITQLLQKVQAEEPNQFQTQAKQFFLHWVELSYITDTQAQEVEMNSFFADLRSFLQIEKDVTNLYSFCNVSIHTALKYSEQIEHDDLRQNNALLNYSFIDSFVKLMVLLLKAFDFNKTEFMNQILKFIKTFIHNDHTKRQCNFNQKPYHKILINILTAVIISDCFNVKTQRQILFDMAEILKELSPLKYPAFAFAWLELISHRLFMPYFIRRTDNQQNQAWYQIKDLIVLTFQFLKQNMIPTQKQTKAMEAFYTGTIRIILLILKDYPDFLCDFHFNFVNNLPDHCIQLKNMILAAVPRSIQAPDPLTKDLRLNIHNEVNEPRILSNYENYLIQNGLKEDLEQYFKSRKQSTIDSICQKMEDSSEKIGEEVIRPNGSVINAVVLYITQQYLKDRRTKDENYNYNELFQQILEKLSKETRLKLLNSIVNELRYPNSHTYSSCLLLNSLFVHSDASIQEQIQRILFERLQSHRPHPWGLSINFRELVQNKFYGFMSNQFMSSNKTIPMLFQNRLRPFELLLEEQKSNQQQQSQNQQRRPHLEENDLK